MDRKLKLSTKNKFIAGVCGGIGEYYKIDPTVVRLIFIFSNFILNFSPILIYIIFWVILPSDNSPDNPPKHTSNDFSQFGNFNDFSEFNDDK